MTAAGSRLLLGALLGSTSVSLARQAGQAGLPPPELAMAVPQQMIVYNFTSPSFTEAEAAAWYESSDTVRSAGSFLSL